MGAVLAIAAPAASTVSMDIRPPSGAQATATPSGQGRALVAGGIATVAAKPVRPVLTETPVDGVEPAGLRALASTARLHGRSMAGLRDGRSDRPGSLDDDASEDGLANGAAPELAALSAPEPVTGYATVGLTWEHGEQVPEEEIALTLRSKVDGHWSGWEELPYSDDHGPDGAEAKRARPGSDPVVVGDVDQVQVRAVTPTGEAPEDLRVAVVDPGQTPTTTVTLPAGATATPVAGGLARGLPTGEVSASADAALVADLSAPRPTILTRAQWGADERMRDADSLHYGRIAAGFVHHTVNANDYSAAQVPSLMRGIYAYHTQSRGWSDIGYNFLVDRFGRIWEGRYGGVARPVAGAHTLGYNDYSFAMSAIGNFDLTEPSAAMVAAYGSLFAWKLSLAGVPADSRQQVGSTRLPAVNGHRDAGSTACPGRYLYAELPAIRARATRLQDADPPPDPEPPTPTPTPEPRLAEVNRSADLSGSAWPDLVVRDSSSKKVYVVRTGGQLDFDRAASVDEGWARADLLAATPDVTGDGLGDMVARNRATKVLRVHPGNGRGAFRAGVWETSRLQGVDQIAGAGDLDGDQRNDLVARRAASKALYLYPGDGRGSFGRGRLLSSSWSYNRTLGAGDMTGDGRDDVVARHSSGDVRLFPGRADGLGRARLLAEGWDVYDLVSGPGDVTADGRPDLVARHKSTGLAYVYPGDGSGGLGRRLGPFAGFRQLDFLGSPGQLMGSRHADLVGRNGAGSLVVRQHSGRRNVAGVDDTGLVLEPSNLLLNVGDWDGDGSGDLMSRSARSGSLYLRRGDGRGRFGAPVRVASEWGSIRSVVAVGDVTRDGHPDLVGRPAGGPLRLYPGDGGDGLLASRRIGAGPAGVTPGDRYDWVLRVGDGDGDREPDRVARAPGTGTLWLFPGGSSERRLIGEGFGRYDLLG